MKTLKKFTIILEQMKPFKLKIVLGSLGIIISSLSYIAVGYLNGAAIEAIANKQLIQALILLATYLVINLGLGIVEDISDASLQKIKLKISRNISLMAFQKVLCLPAYAFEEKKSGELVNRLTDDTETVLISFGQILSLFSYFLASFFIFIYIMMNSYIIGIEIIIFLLLYSLVIRYYNPKLKRIHKERKEENDEYTSLVNESIRGIREIKTLGIKKTLSTRLKKVLEKLTAKSDLEIKIDNNYTIISDTMKTALEVLVFMTCAILLYFEKTSLTFFIAMTYYVYRYTYLLENITSFTKTFNQASVSLRRINEIINNELYKDVKFGNQSINNCQGKIEFKDITFHYPNEDNILNNFNVTFAPNKKIAIVGKSGQGKSTIFNLLTRIFDPDSGNIYIDDIDTKNISEDSLRKQISIIRQEPFLFNKSIKENFEILKPDITLQEIRKFCTMAYIDDYITSLPQKYETILGEGGVNLSGGQKQRLAIARALAKESKIILFDEATSALDNESQNYIKKSIDKLVENHTIIIVAHRLSTIVDADVIYVIDKGKIVDKGTHEQLLKNSIIYQTLYQKEN